MVNAFIFQLLSDTEHLICIQMLLFKDRVCRRGNHVVNATGLCKKDNMNLI